MHDWGNPSVIYLTVLVPIKTLEMLMLLKVFHNIIDAKDNKYLWITISPNTGLTV